MEQSGKVKAALDYHAQGKPGKIEVHSSKSTKTQQDLSLAYSPGVAEPCKAIAENGQEVYRYTTKGNMVAVISNGTAVLGLGNIGPEASKPVMEGKGVLFKVFADVDVFDLELNSPDVDSFVNSVKSLEPTFGGINLEDLKAPECFEIEKRLEAEMNIPVMHDDQHGTAIITGAGLLNAIELADKNIQDVKVVVNGAGSAAVACSRFIISLGVQPENLLMLDRHGVIHQDRSNLDPIKQEFATQNSAQTLAEALQDADVFLGLSIGNLISKEMLKSMAHNPIVFAMANPTPEIDYPDAIEARPDVIMATGRSDYPNQVNNVLGFPFIFRGAMDVRATHINEPMKIAAANAIANLAKQPVPDVVNMAYDHADFHFGSNYILPKPMDPRLITEVAPAVANAAIESGVSRVAIEDWEAYYHSLREKLGLENQIVHTVLDKAHQDPKKVVFTEAENLNILKAANIVYERGYAYPILLGDETRINQLIADNNLSLEGCSVVNPEREPERQKQYGEFLFEHRKRKGLTKKEAVSLMQERIYFGSMMVQQGVADVLISGSTRKYVDSLRPALHTIGKQQGVQNVTAMYILMTQKGPYFVADPTVNVDPGVDELVDIAEQTHQAVQQFNIEPKIAMLSYTNFGSAQGEIPKKVSEATRKLKERNPAMIIDGDIQGNFAVNNSLRQEFFDFSDLTDQTVNTLIFPNLASSNIAYKLLQALGAIDAIGPLILGLNKSINVLQMGSSVDEIVNMTAYGVMDAQQK